MCETGKFTVRNKKIGIYFSSTHHIFAQYIKMISQHISPTKCADIFIYNEIYELIESDCDITLLDPPALIYLESIGAKNIGEIKILLCHESFKPLEPNKQKTTSVIYLPIHEDPNYLLSLLWFLLVQNTRSSNWESNRVIKDGISYPVIKITDIRYFQSEKNYTMIFTKDRKYAVRDAFSSVLSHFNHKDLVRVHRQYAVNVNEITRILPGKKIIELGDIHLPIGIKYQYALMDFFIL